MLTPTRPWLLGLTTGLVLGAVLGAATVSRGTAGRGDADVQARLAALEALTQHLVVVQGPLNGVNGPHLIFEGVNVHIRSGSGTTDDGTGSDVNAVLTGLGNLVIGYNAPPETLADGQRSGSHTLIVGDLHRYVSWGGLVAGAANTVSAGAASVTGGTYNVASGPAASVSGGSANVAENTVASVSGGLVNVASGVAASISGGTNNTANEEAASVSGGAYNVARGRSASVSGGSANTASGPSASVSGGSGQNAASSTCWRAGSLNDGC